MTQVKKTPLHAHAEINTKIDPKLMPRRDLLVIGVGNTLRQDDGVGIYLSKRLNDFYSPHLKCIEVYGPDISLAQEMALFKNILIIDALAEKCSKPFTLIPVKTAGNIIPSGFTSHIFNWGEITAVARDIFGKEPIVELLAVTAHCFGISTQLTPSCRNNAQDAFQFLIHYCSLQ